MLSLSSVGCADESGPGGAAGESSETGGSQDTDSTTNSNAGSEGSSEGSSGDSSGESSGGTPDSDIPGPTDEVDYSTCDGPRNYPDCDGMSCADEETTPYVEVLLDVAASRGVDHVFFLRDSSLINDGDLNIGYNIHVGWVRFWGSIYVPQSVLGDDVELRARFDSFFDDFEFPESIAPLDDVRAAVGGCLGLTFDPCEDLVMPSFTVRTSREGATECSNESVAVVDLSTAEVIRCEEEPVACG